MKLPISLTPWAKYLQIFPDEISLALGNYVQKISPFINPINSLEEIAEGEPNGYDGVNRRGIYERLLLSELALADDLGDEFIRRAVMGEHLFLNLAKINSSAKRVTVALFDAGAMQIGTPRIAQMAALVILARRAESANSLFLWGVAQDEKNLVISDDTESSIKILLESRTPKDVSREDILRWRDNLSDICQLSDVWLIGSRNLSQFVETKGFSHLYIDETLELEKRELSLKIKSASGIEKQISLELPPPNICTRLLRNPFEQVKAVEFSTAHLGGMVTNFFFDTTGSKLFAKFNSSDVLCFDVQNQPGTRQIHPVFYAAPLIQTYIAAGRLRKAVAVATKIDEQTIQLKYRKNGYKLKEGLYRTQTDNIGFPEDESGLLQIYNVRPRKAVSDEVMILDANRNLWLFTQIGQDGDDHNQIVGTLMLSATKVLAVAQTDSEFVYVGCEDENDHHRIIKISDRIERQSVPANSLNQAIFGRGERGKKVIAFEDKVGNWTILDEKDNVRLMPRPQGEVVGVYSDPRFALNAGFFELMEDKQTVEFCWAYGRRRKILTADDVILKIEFSQRSPVLAYQTAGELVLFSLTLHTAIGRYSK